MLQDRGGEREETKEKKRKKRQRARQRERENENENESKRKTERMRNTQTLVLHLRQKNTRCLLFLFELLLSCILLTRRFLSRCVPTVTTVTQKCCLLRERLSLTQKLLRQI